MNSSFSNHQVASQCELQCCSSPLRSDRSELNESRNLNGDLLASPIGEVLADSKSSTMSSALTEPESVGSNSDSESGERSDRNIVCKVLYSNRENVNMIHEVFRQVRVT